MFCFPQLIPAGVASALQLRGLHGAHDLDVRAILILLQFAVSELSAMSDSGVFESLELADVLEASKQEGVYHNNVFLKLKLASPYLTSETKTSVHEVRRHEAAAVDARSSTLRRCRVCC
jgi:hypothetical protein